MKHPFTKSVFVHNSLLHHLKQIAIFKTFLLTYMYYMLQIRQKQGNKQMNILKSNAKAIAEIQAGNLPAHLKTAMIARHEKMEAFGLRDFNHAKIEKLNDFHPLHAMIG